MIVPLEEAKAHLRIETNEEDEYLTGLIRQAQAAAEDYCRRSFGPDGAGAEAPEPVRLAVLLMVSHYHEYRDSPDSAAYNTMRMAFESLLYPYRDPERMF